MNQYQDTSYSTIVIATPTAKNNYIILTRLYRTLLYVLETYIVTSSEPPPYF